MKKTLLIIKNVSVAFVAVIVILPLLVVIGGYLSAGAEEQKAGVPPFSAEEHMFDFGRMGIDFDVLHTYHLVNTFDKPMKIEKITVSCDCCEAIALDSIIAPGDTVSALVIFKPSVIGISKIFLSADNDSGIENQFIVAGIGITSEIKSIDINWGKKRVGTKNDSVFYLHNYGECDAHIVFNGFDGNIVTFFKDSLDNIDTVYLIAGDGDYLPIISEVIRMGKQVYLAAFLKV